MTRLTIFAKGNSDLRDSLHAFRVGDQVRWNGVNEIVRARFPGRTVRLRHETWTRSDALLAAEGHVPDGLDGFADPQGYGLESQFSRAVFTASADVVVLSAQPDVSMQLARRRTDGVLFYPGLPQEWPADTRRRLRENFCDTPLLDPARSLENFRRIVARLREGFAGPILVYNLSAVVPGEWVHVHAGLADTLATRIRRFNLGLTDLSRMSGISVVDIDTLVARHGADRLKLDGLRLNAEGCRLVAEEVVRILEDLGCFDEAVRACV